MVLEYVGIPVAPLSDILQLLMRSLKRIDPASSVKGYIFLMHSHSVKDYKKTKLPI